MGRGERPGDRNEIGNVCLARAYLSPIAPGLTNPLTVILVLAALHAFSTQSATAPLVAGVFVGSAVWWDRAQHDGPNRPVKVDTAHAASQA